MELTLYSHHTSSFNRDDFVNGVLQQRGAGNDYQITGATVTFGLETHRSLLQM
jgi:hypothetical protein